MSAPTKAERYADHAEMLAVRFEMLARRGAPSGLRFLGYVDSARLLSEEWAGVARDIREGGVARP